MPGREDSDLLLRGAASRPRRRLQMTLAALYALIGGAVSALLLFGTSLSLWGLAIGFATMVALGLVTAARSDSAETFGFYGAYCGAFALLTWPVLLLAAGLLLNGPEQ